MRSGAMENLLDHPLIGQRYFFPRRADVPDPFWVESGGVRLCCCLRDVDTRAPTLVYFHGNGEVVADYLDGFAATINAMGCNLLLAEFRGYGMSTGTPALGRMLADAEAVIRALERPQENLVLFGRSVGSLFALHCAATFPRAAGLILESGIADVPERLLLRIEPAELGTDAGTFRRLVEDAFDQRRKLMGYPGAVLVLHTRHDGLVDLSHAERLHAWAPGRKSLQVFEYGDHNTILAFNQERYFKLVEEFLRSLFG